MRFRCRSIRRVAFWFVAYRQCNCRCIRLCLCSLLFAVAVGCGFAGFLELEFAVEQHRLFRCMCSLWFAGGLGLGFVACLDLGFVVGLEEVQLRRAERARVLLLL